MVVRTARAHRHIAVRPTIARIHSVVCRQQTSAHATSTISTRQWTRRPLSGECRRYATAVDRFPDMLESSHDYPYYSQSLLLSPYSSIRPFDTSNLVTPPPEIGYDVTPIRDRFRTGIPTAMTDLITYADACLKIGMLDRAATSLQKVSSATFAHGLELIQLHNRYLRASLEESRSNPDSGVASAEALHKWYELEIRSKGLPQTSETIACMLKASLISERGRRLNRLVLRYMEMAPGELGSSVLSEAEILSDRDLSIITDICPHYNVVSSAESDARAEELAGDREAAIKDDQTPEVLATDQKGFGLESVKRATSLFSGLSKGCDISKLPLKERREIQKRLQQDCIDAAIEKWREEFEKMAKMGMTGSVSNPCLKALLYEWHVGLVDRIKKEVQLSIESEEAKDKTEEDVQRCLYGPTLRGLEPDRVAAVTLLTVLNGSSQMQLKTDSSLSRGMPINSLLSELATTIGWDVKVQSSEERSNKRRRRTIVMRPEALSVEKAETPATKTGNANIISADPAARARQWPTNLSGQLSAMLLSALIETAHIKVAKEDPKTGVLMEESQPGFAHGYRLKKGSKVGVIVLHYELMKLMTREPPGAMLAKHLPMVTEPDPVDCDGPWWVSGRRLAHGPVYAGWLGAAHLHRGGHVKG